MPHRLSCVVSVGRHRGSQRFQCFFPSVILMLFFHLWGLRFFVCVRVFAAFFSLSPSRLGDKGFYPLAWEGYDSHKTSILDLGSSAIGTSKPPIASFGTDGMGIITSVSYGCALGQVATAASVLDYSFAPTAERGFFQYLGACRRRTPKTRGPI